MTPAIASKQQHWVFWRNLICLAVIKMTVLDNCLFDKLFVVMTNFLITYSCFAKLNEKSSANFVLFSLLFYETSIMLKTFDFPLAFDFKD